MSHRYDRMQPARIRAAADRGKMARRIQRNSDRTTWPRRKRAIPPPAEPDAQPREDGSE